MNRIPLPFTLDRSNLATYIARKRVAGTIELAAKLSADTDRERRLAAQSCPSCHYFPAVAGQAFTHQPCACCGDMQTYSTTNTDALCLICAQKHALCKRCMGDIDLNRARTSLEP